ncbi:MAG: hypothetical protein ABSD74_12280 [Rhizomicrobium sp.]|jgi:hypothetical protein
MFVKGVPFILGFATVALVFLASVGSVADSSFHKARSISEIALDRILKIADADDRILDNLFHRYPDDPVTRSQRVDYSRFLTTELIQLFSREQRKLVQEDCGGVYLKGELCGMDYNPVTCTNGELGAPSYSTKRQTNNSALIMADTGNEYTLAQERGVWKLTGVKCQLGRQ